MGQCLAVSGDSVHAVWWDNSSEGGSMWYAHSFDGGTTWSTPLQLDGASRGADFCSIAVSGASVHVAYRDTTGGDTISFYQRSVDGGITWGTARFARQILLVALDYMRGLNGFRRAQRLPRPNRYQLRSWFRRSTDNGTTWDSTFRISNAPGRSEDPSITAADGYVYLAWNDNRIDSNIMQTWYRRSTDNGVTWGPETQRTHTTGLRLLPDDSRRRCEC